PFVSKALRSTSRVAPLLARFASAIPKGALPEINEPAAVNIGRPSAPLPAGEPGAGTGFPLASTPVTAGRPPGCVTVPIPVVKPPFPPLLAPHHFNPNSRAAEPSTSRNPTLSSA